jgi:MoaA/NifB/PqqE/SkfB family radical SAM enzyme
MDPAMFRALIGRFPALSRLHLQGLGEPLLNPHFFAMARHAAERGIEVSATSNGMLLDGRSAALCVESGLACLHVSIDGATAATYESIRKGASFARLRANLGHLFREKARVRSALPAVRMTVVLMRRNLRELPDLVSMAADLGMEEVFVQHLCHSFEEPGLPAHYRLMAAFVRGEAVTGERPE